MNDSAPVGGAKRPCELAPERAHLRDGQGPAGESHGQRLALEPLHHEVFDLPVRPLRAPDVEERADVRVAERRDGLRLALEAGAPVGVGGELAGQHLDRDQAVEPGVAGGEDLAHTPGAEGPRIS